MSTLAQPDYFSCKTPQDLARGLTLIGEFLEPGYQEGALPLFRSRVSSHHIGFIFEGVLNGVQGVVELSWVIDARVKWLSIALDEWKDFLDSHQTIDADFYPHGIYMEEKMSAEDVERYLKTKYVGKHRNRLIDHYLDLLQRMRKLGADNQNIRKIMGTAISRRAHCDRPDDPHRDETLRDLLRKKYELD